MYLIVYYLLTGHFREISDWGLDMYVNTKDEVWELPVMTKRTRF